MIEPQYYDEDDIYQSKQQSCIPFSRSLQNCESAISKNREQFNTLTAFVDLSSVYGNEPFVARKLRSKERSKL